MTMRIAIIGTGISGLVTAHLLHEKHDLTLYEANDYVGGHTATKDVAIRGETYAVDTGFIVFNPERYPNFVKLLGKLGVAWKPSIMSFSVTVGVHGTRIPAEYTGLALRPAREPLQAVVLAHGARYLPVPTRGRRMLLEGDERITLGEYLESRNYSKGFKDYFLVPMGAAIWSADPGRFERFPARYFVEFFSNHGFLETRGQAQWQVVKGRFQDLRGGHDQNPSRTASA